MSQPPKDRLPVRQVSTKTRPAARPAARPTARPRSVPPRRDPFPYVMGAIIGVMVIGLAIVVFLLGANNNNGSASNQQANGANGANGGAVLPTTAASGSTGQTAGTDPPRMPLADFKALYDDPAKRPMIIDVRPIDAYNQGHIKGAISFPEDSVDARINELPKDKLVVAYCQ